METSFDQNNASLATDRWASRSWKWEWVALIGGLVTIAGAVSPPADKIVDQSFSAHMLQHIVLTMISAPLLSYAWPLLLRRWQATGFAAFLNSLTRPAPALILSTIGIWAWHIPTVYDLALDRPWMHALEHLVFIVAFVLFWRPLMPNAVDGPQIKSNEGRVLYLTIGMLTTGLLAAIITFADHLIYTHYADEPSGGRSPLSDQRLGGAFMLLGGAIAGVAAILLTLREEPDTPVDR